MTEEFIQEQQPQQKKSTSGRDCKSVEQDFNLWGVKQWELPTFLANQKNY